jgi:hypothetical protein
MSVPHTPHGNELQTVHPVAANGRDAVFGRTLRYEIAGEEGRALLGSYSFAFTLGIVWLAFVYFGPRTERMRLLSPDEQPIAVTFDALEPLSAAEVGETGEEIRVPAPGPKDRPEGPRGDRAGRRPSVSTGAIADAFGGGSGAGSGGLVGDVSKVLRGVDVASGAGGTGAGAAATGGARGGKWAAFDATSESSARSCAVANRSCGSATTSMG